VTRWWAVAGLAGAVLLALLALSRASQRTLAAEPGPSSAGDGDTAAGGRWADSRRPGGPEWVPAPGEQAGDAERPGRSGDRRTGVGAPSAGRTACSTDDPDTSAHGTRRPITGDHGPEYAPVAGPSEGSARPPGRADPDGESPSTRLLLANVAVTQGLFLAVLAGGLALFAVPPDALGLSVPTAPALWTGAAIGVGLYAANEVGAAVADRAGLGHDERLRELLAPDSAGGWAVLLFVVLPVIAGFEELLFRGVLVGALATGFPVSPWLLAVLSSVAFGVGHGAQGRVGVLVTGVLGFALAAGFLVTGSLAAVVVAHYLVNALEFVVHEGLEVEWSAPLVR
jgi:membrane protease YdiL (CAAX protease family)